MNNYKDEINDLEVFSKLFKNVVGRLTISNKMARFLCYKERDMATVSEEITVMKIVTQ